MSAEQPNHEDRPTICGHDPQSVEGRGWFIAGCFLLVSVLLGGLVVGMVISMAFGTAPRACDHAPPGGQP